MPRKRPSPPTTTSSRSTTPRCPECGSLTIVEGQGKRRCSLCPWKGKV